MRFGFGMEIIVDDCRDLQKQNLKKAGATNIFIEKAFKPKDHTKFKLLLDQIKYGDTLIVWKLSRMSYSFKDLSYKINMLIKRGVTLVSYTENISFSLNELSIIGTVLDTLIYNDHLLKKERTNKGLEVALTKGNKGGRRSTMSLLIREKTMLAYSMRQSNDGRTLKEILSIFKLTYATYYKYLDQTVK